VSSRQRCGRTQGARGLRSAWWSWEVRNVLEVKTVELVTCGKRCVDAVENGGVRPGRGGEVKLAQRGARLAVKR
jgi:hypothetical protein